MQSTTKSKRITNPQKLKDAIKKGHTKFAIGLNYNLKSCKIIKLSKDKKKFLIENCIDGSKQKLTEKELQDQNITNIGIAMNKNAFYIDEL